MRPGVAAVGVGDGVTGGDVGARVDVAVGRLMGEAARVGVGAGVTAAVAGRVGKGAAVALDVGVAGTANVGLGTGVDAGGASPQAATRRSTPPRVAKGIPTRFISNHHCMQITRD